MALAGYAHPGYARSLAEFGAPRALPRCGGWILRRQVPHLPYHDGMGCYPLFACRDWSELDSDVEALRGQLISLSLVTDPFGDHDVARLRQCFDLVMPFKEHFVVDLELDANTFVSEHHRRYARKALQEVDVQRCPDPTRFGDEWADLYATLVKKHGIRGIPAFSRRSLAEQLVVPGVVMFRAAYGGTAIGITLWYALGDVGYYHLGAYSETGYELRASFALFWSAIEHFAGDGLRWLNLGAGAGVAKAGGDGLTRFKQGWATGTRPAHLCGRILDRRRYVEISKARGAPLTNYFPAYRRGEFA